MAAAAPSAWAAMKAGTSTGLTPAKVSLSARAAVTAGLAKDVDDVNQYAPAMTEATAWGAACGWCRTPPHTTESKAKVAAAQGQKKHSARMGAPAPPLSANLD